MSALRREVSSSGIAAEILVSHVVHRATQSMTLEHCLRNVAQAGLARIALVRDLTPTLTPLARHSLGQLEALFDEIGGLLEDARRPARVG